MKEHTMELIKRAREGDRIAREQLCTENVGLVWAICRRFLSRGHEAEDLFQIGVIGLIKAIDKFDLHFNVCFSTYAVPMITGEIKRFLRDDGIIKVSRSMKETALHLRILQEQLEHRLGREASIQEMSEEAQMPQEEIVMCMEAAAEVESIYKTIYQSDGSSICLMDKLEAKENENEEMLDRMVLSAALKQLPERERMVITERYFAQRTQTDIAKELGISQVQVSRLEKRVLAAMKKQLQ